MILFEVRGTEYYLRYILCLGSAVFVEIIFIRLYYTISFVKPRSGKLLLHYCDLSEKTE